MTNSFYRMDYLVSYEHKHPFLILVFPRMQSYFVEPGYFGFFLELSLFSTIYLKNISESLNKNLRFYFSSVFLQLTAIALTLSLGTILCCLVGFVMYLVCSGRLKRIVFNPTKLFFYSLIFIPVIMGLLNTDLKENPIIKIIFLERFQTNYGNSSVDTRTDAFSSGIELIKQRPISGWGFGQVRIALNGMGLNNSILTVFAELGIIGLILYLLFLFNIIKKIHLSSKLSRPRGTAITDATSIIGAMMSSLTLHTFIIDASWSFIYWLGITLTFLHFKYLSESISTIRNQPSHLISPI